MREIVPAAGGRLGRLVTLAMLGAIAAWAALAAPAHATWFTEAANIPTLTPETDSNGDPTGGPERNKGGEAVAIFDADADGVPDVVIANGSEYYFVALGERTAAGGIDFDVSSHLVGVVGDGKRSTPKALGLTDFDADGRLDLYLANNGQGSRRLADPRCCFADPANVREGGLTRDNRYRTYLNDGDGGFTYRDIGGDAQGATRSALFDDFDGDGRQDLFALAAPYYGAWWAGSDGPSQLLPGTKGGGFGENILPRAVRRSDGKPNRRLFQDGLGRGKIDIKGAVARDFDGDGRTDVIGGAYSDVWDNVGVPPLDQAQPEGAGVDLDGDGVGDGGWQGAWKHGILALRNVSKPGKIKFQNQSRKATDQGIGFGDRMHVYETIPVDFNGDGRLDIVASGVRNFTAYESLDYQTPLVQVYKNVSKPGKLRFKNITKRSGLDFLNDNATLEQGTGGRFPQYLDGAMIDGGPLVITPLLSAGTPVDVDNDGRQDIVIIDRQFLSRDPNTGEEYSLWVFRSKGRGRFEMIDPAKHGLSHTGRDIAAGDFNGDGKMDLVSVNGSGGGQTVDDNNYVWLNQIKSRNRWVDVELEARSKRNPLGIGAKVEVLKAGTRKLVGYDEMRTDFAYRSRRDARLHFGLRKLKCVDVRVSGLGRSFKVRGLRADRLQTIKQRGARKRRPQMGCR